MRSADAVRIISVGGDASLAVEVEVQGAKLEVDPTSLDFGSVGQGEMTKVAFAVRNPGHGRLDCRVRARVPWVTVTPSRLAVPAGEEVEVTARIDSESLPPGEASQAWALVVESNGGEAVLGVEGEVLKPELRVHPERLDLGVVDLAAGEGEPAELRLENVGPGVLSGALVSMAEWLTVEPTTFRCRSGESQTVHLHLCERKVGRQIGVVRIASNGGPADVPVHLRVELSLEPEMVFVPAGSFRRGSREDDLLAEACEKPERDIYLSDYWIGKYPVTNAQYAVFVRATGRRPPRHWRGAKLPEGEERFPVVGVSWWDAYAYCQWLADVTGRLYRLPTEAQWEKAARGTDGRRYPWGNRWRRARCNSLELGKDGPMEVGAFSPAGDSVYGCADMAGGVLEWVADWYHDDYYERSSVIRDPYGPASGAVKALRGGSWTSDRSGVRCTSRYNGNRRSASPEAGFRCAIWLLDEEEDDAA
jgi:formylglycine-generating enzyme required for sulfatase activity